MHIPVYAFALMLAAFSLSASAAVKGQFDGIIKSQGTYYAVGWACDPDNPQTGFELVVVDEKYNELATGTANQTSPLTISRYCGGHSQANFAIPLSNMDLERYPEGRLYVKSRYSATSQARLLDGPRIEKPTAYQPYPLLHYLGNPLNQYPLKRYQAALSLEAPCRFEDGYRCQAKLLIEQNHPAELCLRTSTGKAQGCDSGLSRQETVSDLTHNTRLELYHPSQPDKVIDSLLIVKADISGSDLLLSGDIRLLKVADNAFRLKGWACLTNTDTPLTMTLSLDGAPLTQLTANLLSSNVSVSGYCLDNHHRDFEFELDTDFITQYGGRHPEFVRRRPFW